jgi:hypothetical protein
MSLRKDVIGG